MSDSQLPASAVSVESADVCVTILPLLSLVADNEASAEESVHARRHVVVCTACASHLAFLRASHSTMRALPDLYPTPAVRQRIARQTFARPTLAARVAGWFRPAPVRATVGLAAAALVGVAVFLRLPTASDPTNVASQPTVIAQDSSLAPVETAPPTVVASAQPDTNKTPADAVRNNPTVAPSPRIAQRDTPKTNIGAPSVKPDANVPQAGPRKMDSATPSGNDAVVANRPPTVTEKRNNSGIVPVQPKPVVSPITTPKRDRIVVNKPTRVTPPIAKPTPPILATAPAANSTFAVAVPETDDAYDNESRPAPRTVVVANDPDGGNYSPESGRLGIAARRPNVSATISLASDERGNARASLTRMSENNPFSDGPSLRNPIVTSPVSTN